MRLRVVKFLPLLLLHFSTWVYELSTDDLVAATINLGGYGKTLICSAYLPGENQDPARELLRAAEYAQTHGLELLIGADANAHHTIWGSSGINDRVAGMSEVMVELRAPRFVVHGHSAVLRCEHNVDPESIDKVVFFKNGQRIMKYVRGRDPPFELFNISGATINLIKLSPTSITLERMDFMASGPYACEIALETPLYSKVSKIHELMVIVRQKHRPKIKIKHKKLSASDVLEATCQSAPAHPAPHLTWLINNVKVDERLTTPHGTVNVHRYHHGMPLSLTNSSLHFPLSSLQLFPNQTVEITCLSTIPSYATVTEDFADIMNHTVAVNVIRLEPPPTQLPVKVDSLESSSHRLKGNLFLIVLIYVSIILDLFSNSS